MLLIAWGSEEYDDDTAFGMAKKQIKLLAKETAPEYVAGIQVKSTLPAISPFSPPADG